MGIPIDEASMRKHLKTTECPVFWNLYLLDYKKCAVVEKLREKNEEIAGQPWRHVVLDIAICYEIIQQGMIPAASQKLADCLSWIEKSDDNNFLKKYETAFKHLILTFKAYLSIERGSYSEAARCLSQVVDLREMSKPDLAAVYGIKSNVFAEYGVEGTKSALLMVSKALELNSEEPEWLFLHGKLLFRQRNYVLNRHVSSEELDALKKAYESSKKPHTAVYLAQSYHALAKQLFHKQSIVNGKRVYEPEIELELKSYNRQALVLYNEAKEMNKDQCLHIMMRCARGFATLPEEFQNTEMALELVEKVMKKSPDNAMGHAILCLIYRNRREIGAAIAHAKQSSRGGAYGSQIMLFNLYACLHNRKVDIIECLERSLNYFSTDIFRIQMYIWASNFLLFVQRDLFKSLPYFEKALDLDPQFNLLQERYVRWVKVYLNLFELMYNEVVCAIQKEIYINENEHNLLLRMQEKIATAWPSVKEMKIQKDLVNKLKEACIHHLRARGRKRTYKKGAPSKKKKKGNDETKRLKSKLSSTARSKEGSSQKVRSSSDNKFVSRGSKDGSPMNDYSNPQNKRALSIGSRSQSTDGNCKKILKEMENLKNSMTNLNVEDGGLRPDTSLVWGAKKPSDAPSLERITSALSDSSSTNRFVSRKTKNSYNFPRRSVSFNRHDSPQKPVTATTTVESPKPLLGNSFFPTFKSPSSKKQSDLTVENVEKFKNLSVSRESLDSDDTPQKPVTATTTVGSSKPLLGSSFFPTFKSQSSKQQSDLTVENVEKFKNLSVSRESLDSDDTLGSQMSDLSLHDVQHPPSRSCSMDMSRRSVSCSASSDQGEILKPRDWFSRCENEQATKVGEAGSSAGMTSQRRSSNSKLMVADQKLSPSPNTAWFSQNLSLPHRMRDLSLEKKPSRPTPPHQRPSEQHGFRSGTSNDRRSPFGRDKVSEGRVVRPPGSRTLQRTGSETSVSSVDSDYVGSHYRRGGGRFHR